MKNQDQEQFHATHHVHLQDIYHWVGVFFVKYFESLGKTYDEVYGQRLSQDPEKDKNLH